MATSEAREGGEGKDEDLIGTSVQLPLSSSVFSHRLQINKGKALEKYPLPNVSADETAGGQLT